LPGKHFTLAFMVAILVIGLPTAANQQSSYSRLAFSDGESDLFHPPTDVSANDPYPTASADSAGRHSPISGSDSDASAQISTRIGQTTVSGADYHGLRNRPVCLAATRPHDGEFRQGTYPIEMRVIEPVRQVVAWAHLRRRTARATETVKQPGCARCGEVMRQAFFVVTPRNRFRTAALTHLRRSIVAKRRLSEAQVIASSNIPKFL